MQSKEIRRTRSNSWSENVYNDEHVVGPYLDYRRNSNNKEPRQNDKVEQDRFVK